MAPVDAPMIAAGLPFQALSPWGREAQSIAFFNTPDTDQLYSGVTNRIASASRIRLFNSVTLPGGFCSSSWLNGGMSSSSNVSTVAPFGASSIAARTAARLYDPRRRLPPIPRIRIGVFTCDAVVSFFVRRRQFLFVRINDEHGQQLSGFGFARVFTNAVPVTRHLGEALPGVICNDRPIIDRTSDRSFENGRIDESRLWMRVGRRGTSGTIFDQYALYAFAGHIRQSVVVDECDLCIFVRG